MRGASELKQNSTLWKTEWPNPYCGADLKKEFEEFYILEHPNGQIRIVVLIREWNLKEFYTSEHPTGQILIVVLM